MDHHQLPEFFTNSEINSDVYFHYYISDNSSIKNKINFSKNVLCLLVNGEKTIYKASEFLQIDPSVSFILEAGATLMSEKLTINNYKSYLLFFSNKFLSDFCVEFKIDIHQQKTQKSIFKFKKDHFIQHFQNSIEFYLNANFAEVQLKLKMKEILFYLYQNNQDEMTNFISSVLKKESVDFKKVIDQNLDNNLKQEELAFLCNMSISTFKRKFKEHYGINSQKYFMNHRMEKAKQLLQKHKKPSEIYLDLGYENLSSFSLEFKKIYGVSPSKFELNP